MQHKNKWQTPTWLRVLCLTLLVCATGIGAYAQCTNTSAYGSATAPPTVGGSATFSTCNYYGEYSPLNSAAANNLYTLSVSGGGFITVRSGSFNGPLVGSGASPFQFTTTSAGIYYIHWNGNAACSTDFACHTTTVVNNGPASGCSGTPTGGTTTANGVATTNGACVSQALALNVTGSTSATGLTYQWEYSTTGGLGTFAPIVGATAVSYSIPSYASVNAGYYHLVVTCTASALSATSTDVSVTTNTYLNCYCAPTMFASNPCSYINVLTTSGAAVNISVPVSAGFNVPGYTTFPSTGLTANIGLPFNLNVQSAGTCNITYWSVWIDYNQSGTFDASEKMVDNVSTGNTATSFTINVPITALGGNTRMRVIDWANNVPPAGPCDNLSGYYGETEDYIINLVVPAPCSGTPSPGNTLATATSVCPNTNVTFSLQNNTPGSGVTYQWYNNSGAIAGATNAFYTATIIGADDFYADVTCSGNTGSSNLVSITTLSGAVCLVYCVSAATSPADEDIGNVTIGGMNNTSICGVVAPGPGSVAGLYSNFRTSVTAGNVVQGTTVPYSVSILQCNSGPYGNQFKIYIDYNQNGSFTDPGEEVASQTGAGAWTGTGTITIPISATVGTTVMRIVDVEGTVAGPCGTYTWGETEDYLLNIVATTACTGAPAPGNTLASANPVCPGANVTLSLQNPPLSSGNTFQWYNNSGAIAGATNQTYTVVGFNAVDDYYADVTCTGSGLTTSSNLISLTLNSYLNCYCVPTSTNGTSGCFYGVISNVTINTLNHNPPCLNAQPYFYLNPAIGAATTTLEPGQSYTISVTSGVYNGIGVWIDYNQSGSFDATEYTDISGNNNSTGSAWTGTAIVNVPLSAVQGQTRMRVRSAYYCCFPAPITSADACSSMTYGETEDYEISIIVPAPCTGTPAPGNTVASATAVCPTTVVNFGLSNTNLGSGITYQWFNNGGAIAGATNSFYSQSITTADDFYAVVTCTNSGMTTSSNLVSISLNPFSDCYCASAATTTADEEIYQVTVNGASTDPAYANANGCTTPAPGPGSILSRYSNFKTLGNLTTVMQGATVSFEVRENECDGATFYSNGIGIWIDYNHNGQFTDPGEAVYIEATTSAATGASPGGDKVISGTFIVPIGALSGQTAMRVIAAESISGAGLTPCLSYGYGETEDYLINITVASPCAGTPTPGNTLASASAVCANAAVNFTLQNITVGSGVTYQWFNNSGAIAGATNSTYNTIITAANNFYAIVTCSGNSGTSTPVAITVNPATLCYCTPTNAGGACITNVSFATLNNTTPGCTGTNNYNLYPTPVTSVTQGSSYTFSLTTDAAAIASVWIDFNQDGTYAASEWQQVFTSATSGTITVAIPITAILGVTGMRVRTRLTGNQNGASDACLAMGSGETEDYRLSIDPVVTNTTLNLTMFIEGFWDGTSAMLPVLANQFEPTTANATDSIDVELRDSGTLAVVGSARAVLNQNGTSTVVINPGVAAGNYYIVVKHRNAIETWSAAPVAVTTTATYDFSSAASQAYGSNQVQISSSPLIFAFYSGDVLKDAAESTDLLDLTAVEADISNFVSGYVATDVNGDGNVDILDTPTLESNISNFIFSSHP